MGLHFSRIWERMFGKKEMRILMVGLDAAGKVCSSHLTMHSIIITLLNLLTIINTYTYYYINFFRLQFYIN